MKKLFYSIVLLAIAMNGYAQKPAKPNLSAEERADKYVTMLDSRLALTNDQKQKIKQIETEHAKQMKEFRKQDESEMKQKMEQRKNLAKNSREEINTILTAEQKKKFAEMKSELKEKLDGMRKRGPKGNRNNDKTPPPPPPASN